MSSILRPSLKPYPEVFLPEILADSAKRFQTKTAAIHGSQTATFEELEARCNSIALRLAASGVRPGERVALMGQNSIDYIAAFFGILKVGGVVVPFSPAYTAREISAQLRDSDPSAAIIDPDLRETFLTSSDGLISSDRILWMGSSSAPAISLADVPPFPISHPDRIAVIAYSSGTTGVPKGVMLSHRNLVSNLVQFRHQDPVPITDADIFLNHLPFFHIYGMNVLMAEAISVGATQVIMSRFDPDELVNLIARHRATLLFTVPPVVLTLVKNLPRLQQRNLSSLRYVNTGAAPLPPEVAREFRKLTGVPVKQGYGLTETSPTTNADFYADPNHESVGPPVADTEERVVDVQDWRCVLPCGEVGELLVRGPQIMQGYWRDAELTERVLTDGWFHTGDLARMDERGYVSIVGRTKEMIKYKGYTVAPNELEALLLEHPEVKDCAVAGIPDQEAGEIPKAFVVLKSGSTADGEALMEFLRTRVAGYKRVRQIELVDAIPRSVSGKILRRLLVEKR